VVRRRCAFEGAFSLIVKEMCHRGWDVGEGVGVGGDLFLHGRSCWKGVVVFI
jgi:hypothetical protein